MRIFLCFAVIGVLFSGCARRHPERILFQHVGNEDFSYPVLCISKGYLTAPAGRERDYRLAVVSPAVFEACLDILNKRAIDERWPTSLPSIRPSIGVFEVSLETSNIEKAWIIPNGKDTEAALAPLIAIFEPKLGVPPPEDAAGGGRVIADYLDAIRVIGRDPRFVEEWTKKP